MRYPILCILFLCTTLAHPLAQDSDTFHAEIFDDQGLSADENLISNVLDPGDLFPEEGDSVGTENHVHAQGNPRR